MIYKFPVKHNGVWYPAGTNVPVGDTPKPVIADETPKTDEKPVTKTTKKTTTTKKKTTTK